MKIEQLKVLEVEVIGEIKTIKAGIDIKSLPFVFEILSKSFYSNPIGSFIREITSNCVDSHTEAGVTEPVIIKRTYDLENDEYYIHFIDQGVGLSPERVESIYMNYFSSSKREDNTQLGGFGLGSKSPLSYQDLFFIITIFDGIEYEYLLHRGESEPTLNLLETRETTEHNGTTIKVAIKRNDLGHFTTNIRKQLLYFDNVYVDGFGIENEYQILEATTFKYRPGNPLTEIHAVMDKVTYILDWKELGMSAIKIPVGVKFAIGELEITPNREAIRYNERMKKLIPQKIQACLEELGQKYSEQKRETSDLWEYLRRRDEIRILQLTPDVSLHLDNIFFTNYNWKFTPLAHLPIKIPRDPFYMYEISFNISGGRAINSYMYVRDILYQRGYSVYYNSGSRSDITNLYLNNAVVIRRKHSSKYNSIDHLDELGLNKFRKKETYYEKYRLGRQKYAEILPNKPKIVKEYLDYMDNLVHSLAKDYQQVVVPQDFIDEYKQSLIRADYAAKRKLEEKILVRYPGNSSKEEVRLSDIAKTRLVVYGLKEDENLVERWRTIINWNKWFSKKNHGITFFTIAGCYHTQIQKLPNCVYIHEFIGSKVFRGMIKNLATSLKIGGHWSYNFSEIVERFANKEMYDIYNELWHKQREYKYSDILVDMLIAEADKYNCYNEITLLKFERMKAYFYGLEVFRYIQYNIPDVLGGKMLKVFKKRLNKKFYTINNLQQWPSLKELHQRELQTLRISWLTE
jgi:hypothetical protein